MATIEERVAIMEEKAAQFDRVVEKVNAMHDKIMKADGAKWMLFTLVGASGLLGGAMHKLVPWLFGAMIILFAVLTMTAASA